MVGALAGDDPAVGLAGRLAGELHGVLVGIRAAEGEEHPPAAETGALQQQRGELRTRLRAPGAGDEAQPLGLRADRRHHVRVLVTEIAALGEAAHVEDDAAVGAEQPRALPAGHRGRIPLRLHAPAVQHGALFRG